MSFALPSTAAERKLQQKLQQESSFHIQKTHLSKWDLNMLATSAQPNQSLTTVAYGMPTPKTPLSLPDMDITMETTAHMDRVDRGRYAMWDEPVPLTPAPEYTLCSPISLSRIPLKAPTQHECEAAKTLLSLFSPRLESLLLPNESHSMDVEVQAPTPNDLGISAAPLSPLPLSQDISFNSSGCDDYSQNEQDIEMGVEFSDYNYG